MKSSKQRNESKPLMEPASPGALRVTHHTSLTLLEKANINCLTQLFPSTLLQNHSCSHASVAFGANVSEHCQHDYDDEVTCVQARISGQLTHQDAPTSLAH